MIDQQDEIYQSTFDKLENMYATDSNFMAEMDMLTYFYERKMLNFAKKDNQRLYILNNFKDVISSLYFQGYYVMSNLLIDNEFTISNDTWSMSPGFVRNNLPTQMDTIFLKDNIDWTNTEIGHGFGMDILDIMEPAFEIFKQIRKDIANYGAYKALIDDERYVGIKSEETPKQILGNPFEIDFLSPQVYLQGQHFSEQNEVWDLFTWSSMNGGAWVGSCHFATFPIENRTIYLLTISISNMITKEEKMDIANVLMGKISEEIRAMLQTRLYHLEDFQLLIKSDESVLE